MKLAACVDSLFSLLKYSRFKNEHMCGASSLRKHFLNLGSTHLLAFCLKSHGDFFLFIADIELSGKTPTLYLVYSIGLQGKKRHKTTKFTSLPIYNEGVVLCQVEQAS